MGQIPRVLLTHTRTPLPPHLCANLRYLARRLPEPPILITDQEDTRGVEHAGVFVRKVKDLRLTPLEQKFADYAATRRSYRTWRDDLWIASTSRFALQAAAQRELETPIWALEGDYLVLQTGLLTGTLPLGTETAVTLAQPGQVVAGIMWSSSSDSASALVEDLLSIPDGTDASEMDALSQVLTEVGIQRGWTVLPSGTYPVPSRQGSLEQTHKPEVPVTIVGGLLDAAALGQAIAGVDPRNSRGRLRRTPLSDHPAMSTNDVFRIDEEDPDGPNLLLCRSDGLEEHIYGLHIHSKQVLAFTDPWGFLRRQIHGRAREGRFDARAIHDLLTVRLPHEVRYRLFRR